MAEPLAHVTPGQPFHPSAKFHNRTVDTIRWVDEQRVIWGQGSFDAAIEADRIAYIIQGNGSSGNQYFYSSTAPVAEGLESFICKPRSDGTGDDITAWWDFPIVGVLFTGQSVVLRRRKPPIGEGATRWQVDRAGCSAWYGVESDGNITDGVGFVMLPYRRFAPAGAVSLDYCRVPVVAGDATFSVSDDDNQLCDVAFDQVMGRFVITGVYCPET